MVSAAESLRPRGRVEVLCLLVQLPSQLSSLRRALSRAFVGCRRAAGLLVCVEVSKALPASASEVDKARLNSDCAQTAARAPGSGTGTSDVLGPSRALAARGRGGISAGQRMTPADPDTEELPDTELRTDI